MIILNVACSEQDTCTAQQHVSGRVRPAGSPLTSPPDPDQTGQSSIRAVHEPLGLLVNDVERAGQSAVQAILRVVDGVPGGQPRARHQLMSSP